MRTIETDGTGIFQAAREIMNTHSAKELVRIVERAEPRVAAGVRALMARHGVQREQPEQRTRGHRK